jgi:hypothetical protein
MVQAWKHGIRFEQSFENYSSALLGKDFKSAYDGADPDFKTTTSYTEFLAIHQSLIHRFGDLKTIKHTRTIVEGKGKPIQWLASTDATLQFAGGSARFRYSFRESVGDWRLLGFTSLE